MTNKRSRKSYQPAPDIPLPLAEDFPLTHYDPNRSYLITGHDANKMEELVAALLYQVRDLRMQLELATKEKT